jgi:hypothetical protein
MTDVIIPLMCLTLSIGACQNSKKPLEAEIEKSLEIPEKQSAIDTVVYHCDYLGQEPPGEVAELFSPGHISTTLEHSAVMITPDGREMWFGRMHPAKIWYMKYENGTWSDIRKAPLDDTYHYLYPFLSYDGKRLYLTSDRPVHPGEDPKFRGDGDLWYIERSEDSWSEPIHLGDSINFGNRHAIGSIGGSGNIYYTARTGELYHYTTKMYFAEYKNGSYQRPAIIQELNTDHPLHSPFVSPDESWMIFSSFRGGLGMSDLFISFRKEDGQWSTPKNLGQNINSAAKDEYPYVTPDGKYLFFNSSRTSEINQTRIQGGPGNMYWVNTDFIKRLRE